MLQIFKTFLIDSRQLTYFLSMKAFTHASKSANGAHANIHFPFFFYTQKPL